ncbi:TonB-dependent receptor [Chondromyces crocatus]|uniref:TonB-dependent receptor n=1 Tax=Chondromyces crocatus TaxID=52 RepID=A0A0K1EJJ7_CHOCO|nr:TonB-dependent receptor [Chondromyces crocatus]AKT41034.1 TonB-dependent receptor [Chondromyces crocatus]
MITGKVIDASTGKAAADVVVTATSPALLGEQIVVTDGTGQYRIPQLPPGDYTLRFEKETFKPSSRSGITLRSAVTIRIDQQLAPEAVQAGAGEEIVVVGRAPTVDVGSSTFAQNINQDFTRRIAVAPPAGKGGAQRSFESVAEIAPGAKSDTYGTSINGTTSPENQYVIDGVSVNDPAFGIIGTPLTMEFIKEVNVVTGGYMPEYGRSTGGVLDVVTKSGGNEFHGSVFFNISPGSMEGRREIVQREGQTVLTEPYLGNIRDYGFEIGGPIIKDKLWFFAGVDIALTTRRVERYLNRIRGFDTNPDDDATSSRSGENTGFGNPYRSDSGFTLVDEIEGTRRKYYGTSQTIQYIGKLTYQVNQDNTLTLSVYGSPSSSGGNGRLGILSASGGMEGGTFNGPYQAIGHEYVDSATDVSLRWQSAFNNKRVLLDTTLGWHHQVSKTLASDGTTVHDIAAGRGLAGVPRVIWRRNANPGFHSIGEFESLPPEAVAGCEPRVLTRPDGTTRTVMPCPAQTYNSGGPSLLSDATLDRLQFKSIVTGLFEGLGHHVVKGGIDVELMMYDNTRGYSGRQVFRESTGGGNFQDYRMYGFLTGPNVSDYVIFDQIQANSMSTTFGGFVQDSWSIMDKVTVNLGVRYDAQYLMGNDGNVALALPNQWSPRLGVVYDFTQQGRSKLFANYARYYQSVPLNILDRAFGNERQIMSLRPSVAGGGTCDPRDPAQATGAACQADSGRMAINGPYDPNQYWLPLSGGKAAVDSSITPQSSDEFMIGGEYEIFPSARLGATYTRRWLNQVIEDMSRDDGNTYFLGNPGSGIATDFPEATRTYDAVTLYFMKTFADLWLAQATYTASYLRGNIAGLYRPETGQLDPNINSDFDLISLLPNRFGALPGDRTHEIKLYGSKGFEIPGGMLLDLGLSFRSRSGGPTNYLGSHPLYGGGEAYILPRGSGERLPWQHDFDGRIGFSLNLAKDSMLTVSMDIFNMFNFQQVASVDQVYTNSDVLPCVDGTPGQLLPSGGDSCIRKNDGSPFTEEDRNPNFGNPLSYQMPRTFRFGARVTF